MLSSTQFVHGLLESARCDTEEKHRRRMARLARSLDQRPVQVTVAVNRPARRLGVVAMMAAALTVVVIFVLADPGSATDVVAYLGKNQPENSKVTYESIGKAASVYGQLDIGEAGQRLLSVKQPSTSTDCLLLRDKDGVSLFQDEDLPHVVGSWPEWVRVDRLITPIKTPSEWLRVLRESHTFDYGSVDEKQVVVGTRRSKVVDPLVPIECTIWLDDQLEQVVAICLVWMPTGYMSSSSSTSVDENVDYFKRLDVNQDGKVERAEAAGDWGLFVSLGFGERQFVTLDEFCKSTAESVKSGSVELLNQSIDLTKYQPPARLTISLEGIEGRPSWLFELETFRRR